MKYAAFILIIFFLFFGVVNNTNFIEYYEIYKNLLVQSIDLYNCNKTEYADVKKKIAYTPLKKIYKGCNVDPQIQKIRESNITICNTTYYNYNNWKAVEFRNSAFKSENDVPIISSCDSSCKFVKEFLGPSFLKLKCEQLKSGFQTSNKTVIVFDYNDYWNMWWVLVALSKYKLLFDSLNLEKEDYMIVHANYDFRMKTRHLPLMTLPSKIFGTNEIFLWKDNTFEYFTIYKKIIFMPCSTNPSILYNKRHSLDSCISKTLIKMSESLKMIDEKPKNICWISRNSKHDSTAWQRMRTVPNENVFLSNLIIQLGMDVSVIVLEKLSFEQQSKNVGKCMLLVGTHGAGMNSAIYMEDPKVLVLNTMQQNEHNLMSALQGTYYELNNWKVGDVVSLSNKIREILK